MFLLGLELVNPLRIFYQGTRPKCFIALIPKENPFLENIFSIRICKNEFLIPKMNSLNKFLMTLETHFPSPSTSLSSLSCTDTVCTSAFSGKLVHSNFLKKLFYFLTSTLGNQARHLCVPLCDDLPPTTKSPWVYFSLFNISHLWGNFTFYCETSVTRLGDF